MAKDPYKYFRIEARELVSGLSQGLLALERGEVRPDAVAALLRMAHTLKGAARVVKQAAIADLAHQLEEALGRGQEAAAMLGMVDRMGALLDGLLAPAPAEREAPPPPLETLRVEVEELDDLLRGVDQMAVGVRALQRASSALERLRVLSNQLPAQLARAPQARATAEALGAGLDDCARWLSLELERTGSNVGEVQEAAHRLRLVPAREIFPMLERAVRDAAQALGKSVSFEASGGEERLDANVLRALKDALMHVVRNAVVHGIEGEPQRRARGKPLTGEVRVDVLRRGSRVCFACRDDGGGVDREALKASAAARGLIRSTEVGSLSEERTLELLTARGVSTSERVTELSGRGIGLDVARATAAQLGGQLRIRSEAGRGSTVELDVPVSVSSMPGLVVEAAGTLAAIPLDAVRETLRVAEGDVALAPEGETLHHQGRVIPFLRLERALRRTRAPGRRPASTSAVVVESGAQRVAIGVDRLVSTVPILIRSIGASARVDPVISGASLDADGNPQLVLDPAGLVAAARAARRVDEAAPRRPAPILVVDDSLTTRMLEKSILESAGYDVELAVSGEEGLAKARASPHGLFIVDVEMPGMSGFDFVSTTRADPSLREVPAILVTSRGEDEDRQRGLRAGARAYIVKNEFDQRHLLETIRSLVG